MTNLYCEKDKCMFRSPYGSKTYNKAGEQLRRCLKKNVVITDYDKGEEGVSYENETACECIGFRPVGGNTNG